MNAVASIESEKSSFLGTIRGSLDLALSSAYGEGLSLSMGEESFNLLCGINSLA